MPDSASSTQAKISILVCYHQISKPVIAGKYLRPIIVGAANMGEKAESIISYLEKSSGKKRANSDAQTNAAENKSQSALVLRDDVGENISALNPYFCELTAIYWMWKNLDSEYYGLFHYRRVFNLRFMERFARFAQTRTRVINPKLLKILCGLDDKNIRQKVAQYDIITTSCINSGKNELDPLYKNYALAHPSGDLDICIEYIKSHYPHMSDALDSALFARPRHWSIANMFIMRKDLFFEYCEWIFDVLFGVQDRIPYKSYDKYQARVFGFLAERLFNVWLEYKRVQNPELRFGYAPLLQMIKDNPFFGFSTSGEHKKLFIFGICVWKSKIKHPQEIQSPKQEGQNLK